MPEPILATAVVAGYVLLQPLAQRSSAVSPDAQFLAHGADAVLTTAESSISLFGAKGEALSNLATVSAESAIEDWDGYGALPALAEGIEAAASFIRSLPSNLALPEPSVDPDGEISLEWLDSKDRIFSISFGKSDRVAYAGIDGTDRWRGTEHFDGQTIPRFLLMGIERVMG